ncbi:hypothetical protein X741_18175 [Mesorhizobium sp. LNHC229A00]|nr:hypothetical protein X741_18175 [Mesorhizobium sp. LNHC229A00]
MRYLFAERYSDPDRKLRRPRYLNDKEAFDAR